LRIAFRAPPFFQHCLLVSKRNATNYIATKLLIEQRIENYRYIDLWERKRSGFCQGFFVFATFFLIGFDYFYRFEPKWFRKLGTTAKKQENHHIAFPWLATSI